METFAALAEFLPFRSCVEQATRRGHGSGNRFAVGNDIATAWAAIMAGRSGIGPVQRFDASSFPTHFGGEIRELNLDPYMTAKDARRMDAFMQYGSSRESRPCAIRA